MKRGMFLLPALVALVVPTSAGAVTFGSNLAAHDSNSTVTCGDFSVFQYAGRVGCSAYTSGNASNPADTSATHVIPFPDPRVHGNQSGTITEVTFKPAPGAPAGPARLSVVEYIRDANSTANPGLAQDIADGATFNMTPGGDGLVHVATNLPARSLYNANDNSYRYDVLVVSMLDNDTPIPADMNSQFLSAWINPYVDIPGTNGELTVPLPANRQGTGCCGFGPNPFYAVGAWYALGEVLMQAQLTIHPAGGGGGGDQPPPATPPAKFGRARIVGNKVVLPVTCEMDTTCKGLLQLLQRTAANAKTGKAKKPAVYGRSRFSVPAHKTKRVKVALNSAGKKLLRKGRSARVLVRATIGSRVATGTLAIKRK